MVTQHNVALLEWVLSDFVKADEISQKKATRILSNLIEDDFSYDKITFIRHKRATLTVHLKGTPKGERIIKL